MAAYWDEVSLFASLAVVAVFPQGVDEHTELPQALGRQDSSVAVGNGISKDVRHVGSDRPDASIRQRDHQIERSVQTFESARRKQPAEQRMGLFRDPHLGRQHRPELLQSVPISPGTGKTHLSIALGVQAARRGHRVAFATAHEWVLRLGEAKRSGRLDEELERLGRIPLVICDEVGYIPFDPEAAALFFALVSSRYERSSQIVSSNKTFSAWTEIFGDAVAVAAMVDRLVHHAEVILLKGDSYRLKGKRKEVMGEVNPS